MQRRYLGLSNSRYFLSPWARFGCSGSGLLHRGDVRGVRLWSLAALLHHLLIWSLIVLELSFNPSDELRIPQYRQNVQDKDKMISIKMKLLDLFCGGGGAGMGYHRAGFEVRSEFVSESGRELGMVKSLSAQDHG